MRTTKETSQVNPNQTKRSKGDRLGWAPRSKNNHMEVCYVAKGMIVSASECHISAPAQIVR